VKILYVSDTWQSLNQVLYEGAEEMNGMPAFVLVLKRLLAGGHDVSMILYDYRKANATRVYDIRSTWFSKVHVLDHVYVGAASGLRKVVYLWPAWFRIQRAVDKALKAGGYDFVYGQGPLSEAANAAARRHGVPFGQRRYGDSTWTLAQLKGTLYAKVSHMPESLSFRGRKEFMVATQDGSGVDKALRLFFRDGKPPYAFYHWLNGYPAYESLGPDPQMPQFTTPYLLYVARVETWKRQTMAVRVVKALRDRGVSVHLYYAGQVIEPEYLAEIEHLAARLGVGDLVHYVGIFQNRFMGHYAQRALACLSMYEMCNLGNVFIETFASGAVTVSLDDGSLDGVVVNGENGFLVKDVDAAAAVIGRLLADSDLRERVQAAARASARADFLPWNERADREIGLIESCVGRR